MNVFELLRDDLVDEESKQTFLDLHGTWTVLKFCRLNNHVRKRNISILVTFLFTYKSFFLDLMFKKAMQNKPKHSYINSIKTNNNNKVLINVINF